MRKKSKEQSAEWGYQLKLEPEVKPHVIELFEDEHCAIDILIKCQNQWKIVSGMGGSFYTGLDYLAVNLMLDIHYPKSDKVEIFNLIRICEAEALRYLNKS